MSAYTEGPWETQGIEDGAVFVIGANLGGLVGAALPWPTEIDSGDFSRVEANARLIAAAPELLASLREISEMFMARPDMVKALQPLIGFAEKATFDRAAAAIAKATTP